MNQLPESGAPAPKKALPKGCLFGLIAAAGLFFLAVVAFVLIYLFRGRLLNWGVLQGTTQMERVLIRRAGPSYDTTRIHTLFEEYRQAGKEARISVDSLRNLGFYLDWVGDSSRLLDTAEINQILANFKASILSTPDSRLKK